MCSTRPGPTSSSNRNGAPGTKTEWWCHTPSNTWFLAMRDTEAITSAAPGCPETRNDATARTARRVAGPPPSRPVQLRGPPLRRPGRRSVTSALWAAGQRRLGRSFKYHRPRGVLSAANHDVNVMLQDGQR
jgi:hypothetical protein